MIGFTSRGKGGKCGKGKGKSNICFSGGKGKGGKGKQMTLHQRPEQLGADPMEALV